MRPMGAAIRDLISKAVTVGAIVAQNLKGKVFRVDIHNNTYTDIKFADRNIQAVLWISKEG